MSSGVTRTKTGCVVGTGASLDVKTVGFQPKYVKVVSVAGLVQEEWYEGMTEGDAVKQVTDGTLNHITGDTGITPLVNGFTIGLDVNINVAGVPVYWLAVE